MSLAEKLDALREASAKRVPPEKREIMHAATAALRAPAIMGAVIKPGATLPAFALANQDGPTVRSADILARGPAVVTFFRGSW